MCLRGGGSNFMLYIKSVLLLQLGFKTESNNKKINNIQPA